MGNPTSRVDDVGIGVCACHDSPIPVSGNLITGANTVMVEGKRVSRKNDIVLASCGHMGFMTTYSNTEIVEGKNTVRKGDSFTGCFTGSLTTGANTDRTGG